MRSQDRTCSWTAALLGLVLLSLCAAVPVVSAASYCYQETPNVTSVCGGENTGNYFAEQGAINYIGEFYVNYTKPTGVLNTSLWQIKHGNQSSGSTYNITIPTDCWNYYTDRIAMHIESYSSPNPPINSTPYCYNGAWKAIGHTEVATGSAYDFGISTVSTYLRAFDGNWGTSVFRRDGDWKQRTVGTTGGEEMWEEAMYWDIGLNITSDCSIAGAVYLYNITTYDENEPTLNKSSYLEAIITMNAGATTNTFNITSNSTTGHHYICALSDLTGYTVNGQFNYRWNGYPARDYFILNTVWSNTVITSLFMLPSSGSYPTVIEVKDATGMDYDDAYVRAERYYIGENTYRTASMVKTNYDGEGYTYLGGYGNYYRFSIIDDTGTVLRTFDKSQLLPDTNSQINVLLSLQSTAAVDLFSYLYQVSGSCTVNNNTGIANCQYSDITSPQRSENTTFSVNIFNTSGVYFICSNSSTAATGSLYCNIGNTSSRLFQYSLKMDLGTTEYLLTAGTWDYTNVLLSYGALGLMIAAFMMIGVVTSFLWNPTAALLALDVSLITMYMFGLLAIDPTMLVGVIVASGAMMFVMRS
jgi:hypothetical protein